VQEILEQESPDISDVPAVTTPQESIPKSGNSQDKPSDTSQTWEQWWNNSSGSHDNSWWESNGTNEKPGDNGISDDVPKWWDVWSDDSATSPDKYSWWEGVTWEWDGDPSDDAATSWWVWNVTWWLPADTDTDTPWEGDGTSKESEEAMNFSFIRDTIQSATTPEEMRTHLDKLQNTWNPELERLRVAGNTFILKKLIKEIWSTISPDTWSPELLEETLEGSLLDDDFQVKLRSHIELLVKEMKDKQRKIEADMKNMGFDDTEKKYYEIYRQIESSVQWDIQRQIRELQDILPAQYMLTPDTSRTKRGSQIANTGALINYTLTNDQNVFQKKTLTRQANEIDMYEAIVIDRSGSMGRFSDVNSPFYHAIRAAIIRAKVLEHFKVDMAIVIFDDTVDTIMNFGEKFSQRWSHIPAKLMRAASTRTGGNTTEPISHIYDMLLGHRQQTRNRKLGSISFLWDGDLLNQKQQPALKQKIDTLRSSGLAVTAYYVNPKKQSIPLLDYHFWDQSWWCVIYATDSQDLGKKLIDAHRRHLPSIISRLHLS
jgi:hypothetical protein